MIDSISKSRHKLDIVTLAVAGGEQHEKSLDFEIIYTRHHHPGHVLFRCGMKAFKKDR